MSVFLEALGAGAGAAGIQNISQLAFNHANNTQYQVNQAKNFEYSQRAQQNAAMNTKQGLQMAGISPAVLAQGNFSAAQMSAVPLASTAAGMPNIDIAGIRDSRTNESLRESTESLQASQRRVMNAEALIKEREAERLSGEDDTTDAAFKGHLQSLYDKALSNGDKVTASMYKGVLDYFADHSANVGSMRGLIKVSDSLLRLEQNDTAKLDNQLLGIVAQLKLSNGAASILAKMPDVTQKKILNEIAQGNAQIGLALANTKLSETEREKKIEEIGAIVVHRIKEYHSDAAALVENGDWAALASSVGAEALKAAAAGAGFGSGAAVTRGKGAAGAAASGKTPSQAAKAAKAVSAPKKMTIRNSDSRSSAFPRTEDVIDNAGGW